jgi:hypothetical protein
MARDSSSLGPQRVVGQLEYSIKMDSGMRGGLMFMNEDCVIEMCPVDFWKSTQLPRTLQANLVMASAI